MSDTDFDKELKKLNKPYSVEDLAASRKYRLYLTNLTFIVADAWRLSEAAEYCCEVIDGDRTGPLPDLGHVLLPGDDSNRNYICTYLNRLCGQMIKYGEGKCPRHKVIIRASQAAATLFAKLKDLHRTKHLLHAQVTFEEIVSLLVYNGKPTRTPDDYSRLVQKLVDSFIAEMTSYAEDLEEYLDKVNQERKAERRLEQKELLKRVVASDGERTRKALKRTENELKSHISKATSGSYEGCHHPDPDKDKLVQAVIKYLAKPGVTFSINNACVKIAGSKRPGRCKLSWLYGWCHQHEKIIHDAVDALRG